MAALDALHLRVTDASIAFFHQIDAYLATLSSLAEQLRYKKALAEAKRTDTTEAFKKSATGAHLILNGERTELNSTDGDRQIHTTENTQITLNSKNITIKSETENNSNIKDGDITLNAEHITIWTNDCQTDANGNKDIPTNGSLTLNSKQITIAAVDYEQKENADVTEKSLTNDGKIQIRAEDISIDGTDTEGKAVSNTVINSKIIVLASADLNKEEGKINKFADDGSIEIDAANIFIGSNTEEFKTELVQIAATEIAGQAKTKAEFAQGEKGTTLKLADDKAILATTQENSIYGKKITFNGESSFNGKMTAGTINVKSLDVSNKLTAPNLEAGTAATPKESASTYSEKLELKEQILEKLKFTQGNKNQEK